MEWVEISAKTIEEAKDRALDRLGVDERDAEFEVLEEPRVGIFGRAKGEARVRARVKPTAPRPKADGRGRKRADKPAADKPAADKSAAERPAAKRAPKKAAVAAEPAVEIAPADEPAAATDAPSPSPSPTSRPARAARVEDPKLGDLEDLDLEQQTAIVAEVLEGLVESLGLEASVAARTVDEETAEVAIDGSSLGFLVGPRGRTLHALNEVTRSVVLRRGNPLPSARVHVDVAGYRQRRREALAAFSTATAEKVRESGLPHALEPMGSGDRKVVHDTVATLEGVASLSEGEDHERRVVIVPA